MSLNLDTNAQLYILLRMSTSVSLLKFLILVIAPCLKAFFSYVIHPQAVHKAQEDYMGATAVCCSFPTFCDM